MPSAAAVQDADVVSNSCQGGVGDGNNGATGYVINGATNNANTIYPDTTVDWVSYDPYSDKYLLADGVTPAGQSAWTKSASGVGSF